MQPRCPRCDAILTDESRPYLVCQECAAVLREIVSLASLPIQPDLKADWKAFYDAFSRAQDLRYARRSLPARL